MDFLIVLLSISIQYCVSLEATERRSLKVGMLVDGNVVLTLKLIK